MKKIILLITLIVIICVFSIYTVESVIIPGYKIMNLEKTVSGGSVSGSKCIYNPEVKEDWKIFLDDFDIYSHCQIVECLNTTSIFKQMSKEKTIKYYPITTAFAGMSIWQKSDKLLDSINKMSKIKESQFKDGIKYTIYKADDNNIFYVATDNGNIIWDMLYAKDNIVIDIKKTAENKYIVIENTKANTVSYVTIINGKKYIETYGLPFFLKYDSTQVVCPKDVSVLIDNIVRLEYADGSVEHWKVRVTKEDLDKNKIKYPESAPYNDKLLWWNGKGNHRLNCNAWDYNEDTGTEPTYENSSN